MLTAPPVLLLSPVSSSLGLSFLSCSLNQALLRASRIKALSLEPGAPPCGHFVFTVAIQEEDEAGGLLGGQEVRED